MSISVKNCDLCDRLKTVTFHHLIPRTCHTNKWFKKNFSKEIMKTRGLFLCDECHWFIHEQFPEKELGKMYNTLERLKEHPSIEKFLKWVKRQK